jgi:hypothetical protein
VEGEVSLDVCRRSNRIVPIRRAGWLVGLSLLIVANAPTIGADRFPAPVAAMAALCEDCEGAIVDSIVIDNRNIYDLADPRYRSILFRLANRMHFVTRERIIRQELLLAVGKPYSEELAAEMARNLRTRFPMNDAWVWAERTDSGRVIVYVETIDQWSLKGGLRSVDRSGQETNYQVGIEERNLLGRAQLISFDYFSREKNPNYIELAFREPRLLGRPWALGLKFRDDPDDMLRYGYLSHAYYSLAQSDRYSIEFTASEQLHKRFDTDGELSSRWRTQGEALDMDYGHRWGPSHRKVELYGRYRYLHKEIVGDIESFHGDDDFLPDTEDSTYHQFSLGGGWSVYEFIVEKRINGFDYSEDFTLGLGFSALYGRAFLPDLGDHYYDYLTGVITLSEQFGHTLVGARYDRSIWFRGDQESRRVTSFEVSAYDNRLSYLTWAARSLYVADRGGTERRLVIGGKSGLRGYPTEFMAGDRLHAFNLEGRFFPGLELLSVKIGGAIFTDIGRTWQPGEPLSIEGYRISAGVGLRLSLETLRKGKIIRIDASVLEGGGLEISYATGQYF